MLHTIQFKMTTLPVGNARVSPGTVSNRSVVVSPSTHPVQHVNAPPGVVLNRFVSVPTTTLPVQHTCGLVSHHTVSPCVQSVTLPPNSVSVQSTMVSQSSQSVAMLPSGGSVYCTSMSLGVPSTSPTMPIPPTQTPLNVQPIPVVPSTQPTSTHLVTVPETTPPNQGAPTTVVMPATLTQQLPPIPWFKGEDPGEDDSFQDWIEQFESVAILGGWSEQGKLVHLPLG